MQSTNIPTKIPLPFANSAGVGYITAIPVASQIGVVDGRASLHDGFPPLNFTAISSGGIPPFGADVNGILFESTAILQWQQAGGFFPYDPSFSGTVGGYPLGAVIQAASFSGFWTSTAENNTTNPDTGGAGWIPTAFSGLQSIALSGASVTLTKLQSAYPIIVLTGTLTQNCNVILANVVDDWIIANNTTGAYTVQVKTAAGTGVNIAQNSSQYIWGDSINIYYANASSVTSFNTRTGAITLTALDVTDALGFTPAYWTSGMIMMWAGAILSVPAGWFLCNGSNNTPDLRDRFIVGSGSTYTTGNTGGSANSIVPSHTHGITDPGHFHSQTGYTSAIPQSNGQNQYPVITPITLNTGSKTTGITINTEGVSPTNANLPPYYALAYIMKS